MTLAGLGVNAAPVLISTMMDGWHLNEAFAGSIVGGEILAGAVVVPPAVRMLGGRALRTAAVWAALVLATLQLTTAFIEGTVGLAVCRLASGVVCGVLWAVFSILLAEQKDPDRVYGVGLAFYGTFYAIVLGLLLGYVQSRWNVSGVYISLAAIVLVVSGFLIAIPAAARPGRTPSSQLLSHEAPVDSARSIVLVIAAALFNLGTVCSYYFSPRIARILNMDAESVGLSLGLGNAALVLGALLVTAMETRIRRTAGLAISMLGNGIFAILVLLASSKTFFYAGILGFNIFNGIYFPFISGAAAAMDKRGRVVGWLNSINLFTIGVSPVIGGWIVAASSYRALAACAAPALIASIPMAMLAARPFDRRKSDAGALAMPGQSG
jgi:predicted MFS family arabinose efflux permease